MKNNNDKKPTAQELYDKAWWLYEKKDKVQLYSICKTIFETYPNTKQARWVVDNFKINATDITSWEAKQLPAANSNNTQEKNDTVEKKKISNKLIFLPLIIAAVVAAGVEALLGFINSDPASRTAMGPGARHFWAMVAFIVVFTGMRKDSKK